MSFLIRRTAVKMSMIRATFSTTSTTNTGIFATTADVDAVTSVLRDTSIASSSAQQELPISQIMVPKSYNLRGARKRLIKHGIDAILPSVQIKFPENYMNNDPASEGDNEVINVDTLPGSEKLWKAAKISRRKIAVLRKEAIRTGTYGTFDAAKGGVGWDPLWDIELMKHTTNTLGRYMSHRISKKSTRMRTRAMRAQKIDTAMIDMEAKKEELQASKHRNKPPITFESTFKKLMKVKK